MGFLDRMLTDLIAGSAPRAVRRPVRKMVRSVGAGKLLLLGGAAVAGVIAAQRASATRSPDPGAAAPLPPLPPLPTPSPSPGPAAGAGLPPLPPIPSSAPSASEDVPPDLAYPVVRAMVGAALSDGELGPAERVAVQEHLGDASLPEPQVRQIHRDLVVPPSPEEVAAMVGGTQERAAVYRAALLVTLADHDVSRAERSWLDRLGTALQLTAEARADLERDLHEAVTVAFDRP